MKTDAEIRAKWKEVLDRPRSNPHVIDTGAFVIEVVRWAESGPTPRALDGVAHCANCCDVCSHGNCTEMCSLCKQPRQ